MAAQTQGGMRCAACASSDSFAVAERFLQMGHRKALCAASIHDIGLVCPLRNRVGPRGKDPAILSAVKRRERR
jgi:hypothetical protein